MHLWLRMHLRLRVRRRHGTRGDFTRRGAFVVDWRGPRMRLRDARRTLAWRTRIRGMAAVAGVTAGLRVLRRRAAIAAIGAHGARLSGALVSG